MDFPVQITFRDMPRSEAIEKRILERANKLSRFSDQVVGCRVVVESPHRHHSHGKIYHVRIDLTTKGDELVVSRDPASKHAHEDAYVAVRDAFDAMQRQLQDYVEKRRGRVKTHEEEHAVAQVRRLLPEEGYGFIETVDGREVYFHEHAVKSGTLEALEVGQSVRFVEEEGDQGPQASAVWPA